MKSFKQITALFLCLVLIFTSAVCAVGDTAADEPVDASVSVNDTDNEGGENNETDEPEKAAPELVLSDSRLNVTIGASMQIKAELKNFETQSAGIVWSSDNTGIATVDNQGNVSGKAAGSAVITATAMDGETPVSASCAVNVVKRRGFPHFFLSMNYKYANKGDYYYSNNDITWQMPFGFIRLYDNASQLIGYQYDFARVVFTYGNKDWLVQFWKGQYGLFQLGGEIGVYTKYAVGFGDTLASAYQCAGRDDWLDMEMTLYHQQPDGSVIREFTREYGKYWWCDGYKIGKLNKNKPATELQMVSRITLKDEQMATAFAKGMRDCGFSQVARQEDLTDDTFCLDGKDVCFIWRNLTEPQALIPITVNGESTGILPMIGYGFVMLGEAIARLFSGIKIGA